MKEGLERLIKSWYEKSSRSLYYFCKVVLGYRDMYLRTHGEVCKYLEDRSVRNKLILLPRGVFKTSIGVIGYSIWSLLFRDSDLRILISSDTYDNAVKILFRIKQILEKNEIINLLFGDVRGKRWREDELDISLRKELTKEPSISCGSQDVTRVGQHYDVIILDDIVTDVNVQTVEQMKKTVEYFKSLYSILEPDGEMIVIGTRWSNNSWELYEYILRNLSSSFKNPLIRSAVDKDGRLYFPTRLTRERLNELLKLQGSYMFSCQYMNSPMSIEEQVFKNIDFFDNFNKIPTDLSVTITVDPSMGLDDGDYTGIVVCGTDSKQDIYVLDALRLKCKVDELIETLFYLKRKWGSRFVGIETVAFQKVLKYWIDIEEQRRRTSLGIIELKPDTRRSKFSRILRLQPFVERHQIKVYSKLTDLIEEMYMFPRGTYDDLIDALAYQLDIYSPPPPEDLDTMVQDDWERYVEAKKVGKAVKPPWWYREARRVEYYD